MDHIYHLPQFGENWFDYSEMYDFIINHVPDKAQIVEIGCWKGKSVAYLAVQAINSGKDIKIDAIDTWLGSIEHMNDSYVKSNTLYELFLKNIEPLRNVITPIRDDSLNSSEMYKNESVDAVFIDAAHDYYSVKKDIAAWLPIVKKGGIIAGHDYNDTWVGVKKAVNEAFTDFKIMGPCWYYIKNENISY